MPNEAEIIARGTEVTVQLMQSMIEFLNQMYSEYTFRSNQRMIAQSLMRVTDGGTKLPYLQPFGAEHSRLANEVIFKVKEHNKKCRESGNRADYIDYYVTRTLNGEQVIWTNEQGMEQIESIKKDIAINKGLYYTEIKSSELYKANEGKDILTIKNIDSSLYDLMKSKPLPSGNDFSFSTENIAYRKYTLGISENDFINSSKAEDMFTNLLRANVNKSGILGNFLAENAKYDKALLKQALYVTSNDEDPFYITSATDGGRYIKITSKGFKEYSIGLDGANIKQVVTKEVMKPRWVTQEEFDSYDNTERKKILKEQQLYKKELIKAVKQFSRPVGLNKEIFEEHKNVLRNTFGDKLRENNEHKRAINVYYNAFYNPRIHFYFDNNNHSVSELQRSIMNTSKCALMADITAVATENMKKNNIEMSVDNLKKELDSPEINRRIQTIYLRDYFNYMRPDLANQFISAIRQDKMFNAMKKQYNSELDPRLKEEMGKMISESYESFLTQAPKKLKDRISNEISKFSKELKDKSAKMFEAKYTQTLEKVATKAREEKTNEVANVILANCVTGKNIEGLRPLQTDIDTLKKAETLDQFAKCVSKEIESKIMERRESNPTLHNLSPIEIVQTPIYINIVKSVVNDIKTAYKNGSLMDRSNEWKNIVIKSDELGLFSKDFLYKIQESALKLNKLEFEKKKVTPDLIKNVEIIGEKENSQIANHWKMLDYEKNEEEFNNFLKNNIYEEDIDIDGATRIEKHSYEEYEEDKEKDTLEDIYNKDIDDLDRNGIDDHDEYRDDNRNGIDDRLEGFSL